MKYSLSSLPRHDEVLAGDFDDGPNVPSERKDVLAKVVRQGSFAASLFMLQHVQLKFKELDINEISIILCTKKHQQLFQNAEDARYTGCFR